MKLYASGFNAWNQLVFDEKDIRDEPDDIRSFEVVLEGGDIELPISRLSYTLGAFGPIVPQHQVLQSNPQTMESY